jgi:hypothetical protein
MAETCRTECPLLSKCEARKSLVLRQPDDADISLQDLSDTMTGISEFEDAQKYCQGHMTRVAGYIVHAMRYAGFMMGHAFVIPTGATSMPTGQFQRCPSIDAKVAIAGMPDIVATRPADSTMTTSLNGTI